MEIHKDLAPLKERASSEQWSPNVHVPKSFAGGRHPYRLASGGLRNYGEGSADLLGWEDCTERSRFGKFNTPRWF
jgi:hypothetical protein